MEHHRLDPYPIPKERTPLYVNEPWLADKTLLELPPDMVCASYAGRRRT